MRDSDKLALGLGIGLIALIVTSNPNCRAACQQFFQPIATGAGRLAFAGLMGALGASLV